MKAPRTGLLIVSLALIPLVAKGAAPAPDDGGGGIVTLYAKDDLESSFDFRSGSPGGVVWDGEILLTDAQMAYDIFAPEQLSLGFSLDERVEVLDLGPVVVPPLEQARDRTAEIGMSLFHTLFRGEDGFSFVGPGGDVDPYERADRILKGVPPQGMRHFSPMVGHTYLLRVRRNGSSSDEVFKFLVLGILPGHSLTLRWAPA